MNREEASWIPIRETVLSRENRYYRGAGGEKIYNEGERIIDGISNEGVPINGPVQIAPVERTLWSTREMKEAASATVIGLDSNHQIVDKRSGKVVATGGTVFILNNRTHLTTGIRDNGKEFILDVWIKRPRGEETFHRHP